MPLSAALKRWRHPSGPTRDFKRSTALTRFMNAVERGGTARRRGRKSGYIGRPTPANDRFGSISPVRHTVREWLQFCAQQTAGFDVKLTLRIVTVEGAVVVLDE
jgi:hypothetical protein